MKKISLVVMLCVLLLSGCGKTEKNEIVIGVIQWATHPALNQAYDGMVEEIESLNNDNIKIIHKNADDDSSNAQLIVEGFIQDKVDVIYAIATPAAQTVKNLVKDSEIPFVFNAVSDPVSAGLVESMEKPGTSGTGVSDVAPIKIQLDLIKEILPNAKNIGILYNTGEANSAVQLEEVRQLAPNIGLNVVEEGIANQADISLVAENMAKNIDAFYIITDNMIANAAPMIVNIGNSVNIPVFMAESTQIENGVLASDSISYFQLGKQAGQMIKKIAIDDVSPNDIPVEISQNTQLIINVQEAKDLGIEIPAALLERAELVNE